LLPTERFAREKLRSVTLATGTKLVRIFKDQFPDPLGYGLVKSRFSHPRPKLKSAFGVVYFGESLKVCFVEAIIRARFDGQLVNRMLKESELYTWSVATVEVSSGTALKLLELRGDGLILNGIPSDAARASSHKLGQAWSKAIHGHPEQFAGISYSSRFNEEGCFAIYDRALGALKVADISPLWLHPSFADTLDELEIGIEP